MTAYVVFTRIQMASGRFIDVAEEPAMVSALYLDATKEGWSLRATRKAGGLVHINPFQIESFWEQEEHV